MTALPAKVLVIADDPTTSRRLAEMPPQAADLSVAPDGSAVLFDLPSRQTSDLVLVENFR